MQFRAKLPSGQELIVTKAFWTGKTEVRLDNGIVGTMGFNRQQSFSLKYKDGSEHSLLVKQPLLDPMPLLLVDGNDVLSSHRFDKIQTAVICLPALLILQLGAIPALLGCGGVYLNFFIARHEEWKPPVRWTLIGTVPVVGLAAVFIMHGLVWGAQSSAKTETAYHLKTQTTTHHYDPTEDDNNPRLCGPTPETPQLQPELNNTPVKDDRLGDPT